MLQQSFPAWVYPVILLGLLLVAGVAEYLKMIPSGTFGYIFAITLGLIAPSPVATLTHVQAPAAPTATEGKPPTTTRTPITG